MKKSILVLCFAVIAAVAVAKVVTDRLARPVVMDGFQIYILSTPVDDYEKIGYVKNGVVWDDKPDQLLKSVLKKAKKDFPTGDAIIFSDEKMKEAMVVKFR